MTILALYQLYLQFPNIQTDTRKLQKGDFFFALKGPNFNANSMAAKALELGAAYAVVDDPAFATDERIICVEDSLATLQALAKHHRQQFSVPVIGITGSNGKTTSKELVHAVLSTTYKTYTTEGNLNNHIGIPLTLLKIKADAQMAVVEMGANHQKEIESYCQYALPTHGIITNCGKAHLEGFGGEAGVRKGKGELYDFIRATNGAIFIYKDYDYLIAMSKGIEQQFSYGSTNQEAQTLGHVVASQPFLQVAVQPNWQVQTNMVGDYNLPNILLAFAVGRAFGISDQTIQSAIEQYQPDNSRSQMVQWGSNQIILDAYNANPSSMKLAIENMARQKNDKKVLLLGGMREMGEASIAEHSAIVELINQYQWHKVVLVGTDFDKVPHAYTYCNNSLEAGAWLQAQALSEALILVKGSRGLAMEKALPLNIATH
jgi:UDP-N-acetylmuramoyl-tripeptide--D-alanyl-D-alanine ligase